MRNSVSLFYVMKYHCMGWQLITCHIIINILETVNEHTLLFLLPKPLTPYQSCIQLIKNTNTVISGSILIVRLIFCIKGDIIYAPRLLAPVGATTIQFSVFA